MARPREFDRTDAVEAAMNVFWEHGFEGASLSRLTGAMGLSKSSFYDTFESKRQLYLETIDHYNQTLAASRAASIIAAHDNPLKGVRKVFSTVIQDVVSGNPVRGCFINNCAGETGPDNKRAADLLAEGLTHVEHTFEIALRNAVTIGKLGTGKNPKELARYLASTLHGVIVVGKAKRDAAALEQIVDIAFEAVG